MYLYHLLYTRLPHTKRKSLLKSYTLRSHLWSLISSAGIDFFRMWMLMKVDLLAFPSFFLIRRKWWRTSKCPSNDGIFELGICQWPWNEANCIWTWVQVQKRSELEREYLSKRWFFFPFFQRTVMMMMMMRLKPGLLPPFHSTFCLITSSQRLSPNLWLEVASKVIQFLFEKDHPRQTCTFLIAWL